MKNFIENLRWSESALVLGVNWMDRIPVPYKKADLETALTHCFIEGRTLLIMSSLFKKLQKRQFLSTFFKSIG